MRIKGLRKPMGYGGRLFATMAVILVCACLLLVWCVQSRGVDISVLLSRVVRGVEDDTGGRQKPYTNFYTTAPDPLYLSQGTHHPHAPPRHLLICSHAAIC